MSGSEAFASLPDDFQGVVRLFPLPNLVLFPHVMQPVHIFEPRYREMLEDALAGDGLMAMSVLAPGWEANYEGRPPLYPHACLARVASHHKLDDGTYNLLVLGLRRVRLLRELPPKRPFRSAEVEICEDFDGADRDGQSCLHRRLRQAFLKALPLLPQAQEQVEQLFGSDVALGMLTDVVSYMLDISVSDKVRLLGEPDIHRRAEHILRHLTAVATTDEQNAEFPPPFSTN
ncbi:MAG: LON peptidase substrate-binding domain-containing protein [Planctomycetota bacterium]